jgi:DNA topoisomerase-1
MEEVNSVMQTAERVTINTNIKCPNCGKPMVLRTSRKGSQFLGCSGYPDCKTAMSLNVMQEMEENDNAENGETKPQEICEEKCENCGSEMKFKIGPYGKYMECTNPECGHRKPYRRSTGVTCPKCGEGTIVERKSKKGMIFYGCDKFPKCDFVLWNEPTGDKCPECGNLLVKKVLKNGTVITCSNIKCSYKQTTETTEEV